MLRLPHVGLQVLQDRLPFDEVALLQENGAFITRCALLGGCRWRTLAHTAVLTAANVHTHCSSPHLACLPTPTYRALGIANLSVHPISYEQQQTAENAHIAGATPGSPATLFQFA